MSRATVSKVSMAGEICAEPRPDPFGIIIFGASGDLTKRKLVPALYHLMRGGLLPERWYMLGLGRTPLADEEFRKTIAPALPDNDVEAFCSRCHYLAGDSQSSDYYRLLSERLEHLDRSYGVSGNRLFYLATPPGLYRGVIRLLGESGLSRPAASSAWVRIVVEKPFGSDLKSASSLNEDLRKVFDERQVFRIDHYLGKETVQNILFFRFANAIFEPIWNNRYIDHVQILSAEAIGIEHRAGYYEGMGALRDMFQNHLLQLLCLVALEPPASFEADSVRDERVKVMRAVRPVPEDQVGQHTVRGQYGPGLVDGQEALGYRSERGIPQDSRTETYAALKLHIDNWRWQGVPFYLRSGKRLARRVAEIAVEFKKIPHLLFRPLNPGDIEPNRLVFRIQPDEGISLTFQAKEPGPKLCMDIVTMNFHYHESFETGLPEAYERLLLDCLIGDQTLFARRDWVELSWRFIDPILEGWRRQPASVLHGYPAGGWGPKEAEEFISRNGRRWRFG